MRASQLLQILALSQLIIVLAGRLMGMNDQLPAGPELPTLAEKLVRLSRLGYTPGCFFFGFIVLGLLNLVTYLPGYSSFAEAAAQAIAPQNLGIYVVATYLFYAPRYMRLKILEAEPKLSALLENGERSFHILFGRISTTRPQLLAWVIFTFGLPLTLTILPALLGSSPSPSTRTTASPLLELTGIIANILFLAQIGLGFSSLAWSYYQPLRGIRQMGALTLKLRPFYADPFLGLRPVGTLALSLAIAYFGMLALIVVTLGVGPTPALGDLVGVSSFLVGLIILGVAMFFLPLRRLHRRMAEQKTLEKTRAAEKLGSVINETPADITSASQTQWSILDALKADMIDRKVSSIATWPFDFQVLGKLTIITLSIAAALLTRMIALVLRI